MIRRARAADLPALPELERAAGAPFRDLGMAAVADDASPTVADLALFQREGRAWVVTDGADTVVAYVLVDVVDGNAHIEQVSVHPGHAHHGLGKALLDTAANWADHYGLAALTLMTYAHVPWNAPYYERLGFEVATRNHATSGRPPEGPLTEPGAPLTGSVAAARPEVMAVTWPRSTPAPGL